VGQADTLVFVTGVDSQWRIEQLFTLLRAAGPAQLRQVMVVDDTLAGLTDPSRGADLGQLQGLSGFLKTLQQEWMACRFTMITLATALADEELPGLVIAELADPQGWPELMYDGGSRYRPVIQPAPALGSHRAEPGLADGDVVVVLGGAQGICPGVLTRLAGQVACHFVLVGRTERNQELAGAYADCASADQIQQRLIHVEQMDDPKQVAARVKAIAKAQSIESALRQIADSGATATYVSADVTDRRRLRALLMAVRDQYGHLDGLVHAAGLLHDKLFVHKTWQSFAEVFATKTNPLTVIGELADQLKLVVFFSSVAGRFGNRGQCDYAAGNAALDQAAWVLSRRGLPARVVSIAWGPWLGAGMVSAELAAQMRRRGLELLPPAAGADCFAREVLHGQDPGVIVMAARPTGLPDQVDIWSGLAGGR
jgi:NAD(P)-dependent dehydrogenase (short-subunit alcohol dehydrogenase family)